mmetsp:Transcript_40774/g.87555  ORF Transcript_40774/g.87555 Transcript_40774/m.87555 type:complete len:314 (+) Transcript_40774:174-1115(+)|eukprot:CAMPEP_0206464118 /NCGR_PEP_ID=MMETSP0324_2-20121206/27024_1 /ASSEMBLY_ACC=CAM_ASM_000836 /TAXON_ID=2866 /ORGANISM="Crypthecodinium cohnii, Strain Seligo" /LENGTH=313 /DNA_ID=CAMNT_0053936685 /DNA_START=173 /DNA_END=1114 /DNA_ORIENTATION=-
MFQDHCTRTPSPRSKPTRRELLPQFSAPKDPDLNRSAASGRTAGGGATDDSGDKTPTVAAKRFRPSPLVEDIDAGFTSWRREPLAARNRIAEAVHRLPPLPAVPLGFHPAVEEPVDEADSDQIPLVAAPAFPFAPAPALALAAAPAAVAAAGAGAGQQAVPFQQLPQFQPRVYEDRVMTPTSVASTVSSTTGDRCAGVAATPVPSRCYSRFGATSPALFDQRGGSVAGEPVAAPATPSPRAGGNPSPTTPPNRHRPRASTPGAPKPCRYLASWEKMAMTHGGSSEWEDDDLDFLKSEEDTSMDQDGDWRGSFA